MMKEVFRGTFKRPWGTIIAIPAMVLYVLMPFDLIPDFLPFIGWLDDVFVVAKLFTLINIDLRRFLKQRHIDPEPFNL